MTYPGAMALTGLMFVFITMGIAAYMDIALDYNDKRKDRLVKVAFGFICAAALCFFVAIWWQATLDTSMYGP